MFQFETSGQTGPVTRPAAVDGPGPGLSHKAFLSWAEHCVECAAPSCYQTCDLYDPTSTGKCRRFTDGLVRTDSGAQVKFRKWAKLETQGSATMLPVRQVERWERLLDMAGRPLELGGKIVSRLSGRDKFLLTKEAVHKRLSARASGRKTVERSETFLAEMTNLGTSPAHLILTAYVDKNRMATSVRVDQLPPPVSIALELPPGFSRHVHQADPLRPVIESGLPFNLSVTPQDDAEYHIVFHRLDLGILQGAGNAGVAPDDTVKEWKPAKLVVFDLDNTLWQGILLEGQVSPYPGLRNMFERLDERGILVSIASKNAHEDAIAELTRIGVAEYLLHPQISWNTKSESVKRIVQSIDIGSDTVIFVDDNPFEREEVASAIPGIQVLPETSLPDLLAMPRLQGSSTPEARERRKMYQAAAVRSEVAANYGDDYLEFLRNSGIVVTIRRDLPDDAMRVAELVQRTNQLNFSGTKYTREQTEALLSQTGQERYVIECRDKFGSYGTVGFCLVERVPAGDDESDVLLVQDLMLSCRVQGKFIEQALLWTLAEKGSRPVAEIRIAFRKTERNKAAQMVLEKLDFRSASDGDGYERQYVREDFHVDFMAVQDC